MKLKFIRNRYIFKVTNSTLKTVSFHPKKILGAINLRLLGYYKRKQGVLQQKTSVACITWDQQMKSATNSTN